MAKKVNMDALKNIMSDSEMKENSTKKSEIKTPAGRRKKRLGNVNITLALNTMHYNQLMDYLDEQSKGVTPFLRELLYEKGIISDDFEE